MIFLQRYMSFSSMLIKITMTIRTCNIILMNYISKEKSLKLQMKPINLMELRWAERLVMVHLLSSHELRIELHVSIELIVYVFLSSLLSKLSDISKNKTIYIYIYEIISYASYLIILCSNFALIYLNLFIDITNSNEIENEIFSLELFFSLLYMEHQNLGLVVFRHQILFVFSLLLFDKQLDVFSIKSDQTHLGLCNQN